MRIVAIWTLAGLGVVGGGGAASHVLVGPIATNVVASSTQSNIKGVAKVRAQGRLEPAGGVYRVGLLAGARVGQIHVVEGSWVNKGDLLATLDGDSERQAEADLIVVQISEIVERREAENAYQRLLLDDWELQSKRAQEVESVELPAQSATMQKLRESVEIGERQLRRLSDLHKAGSVASDQVERQELEVRKIRADLDQATYGIDKLRRTVANGKIDLRLQREKILVGSQRSKLAMSTRTLEKQLQLARSRIEAGRIKAPVAGQVLRLLVRPGETVTQAPIVQLGDTHNMYASVEVDEADILTIKPGQKATVTVLGQRLPGMVQSVGLVVAKNELAALDPTARNDARVVEVKIKLEPNEVAGRLTNLQVEAEIETQSSP